MILCYSGTGNSRYIAQRIADELQDNIIDLNAFDGLTLNYGNDFYNYIDKTSSTMGTDIYIINDQSHQIYYLRGISVDGYTYYTNEFEKTNVN